MSDQQPEEFCCVVEVDGQPVRVTGGGPLTDTDRMYLTEVIRAAKRRYEHEHGGNPDTPKEH